MTILAAKAMSAFILLIGLSILLNPRGWQKFFKRLLEHPEEMMPMMMLFFFLGCFYVFNHNIWGWHLNVVITVFGWGMLIKSILYLLYPKFILKFSKWADENFLKIIRIEGLVYTALGVMLVVKNFS